MTASKSSNRCDSVLTGRLLKSGVEATPETSYIRQWRNNARRSIDITMYLEGSDGPLLIYASSACLSCIRFYFSLRIKLDYGWLLPWSLTDRPCENGVIINVSELCFFGPDDGSRNILRSLGTQRISHISYHSLRLNVFQSPWSYRLFFVTCYVFASFVTTLNESLKFSPLLFLPFRVLYLIYSMYLRLYVYM